MGKHYLPQYYLKGFSKDDISICMYEKKVGILARDVAIKKVASMADFYSPGLERQLADDVEKAAHKVLDRIRNKEQINNEEKIALSEYIVSFIKRVPESWNRFLKLLPRTANDLYNKIIEDINLVTSENPEKSDFFETQKQQIRQLINDIVSNPNDNKDIWEYSILPKATPLILAALQEMRWTFLVIEKGVNESFLTCDNPVFFFTGMGLDKIDSEVSFPISSKMALWVTWKKEASPNYVKAPREFIREFNRRTAHNSTRFIFHNAYEEWVDSFVKKGRWRLNIIRF